MINAATSERTMSKPLGNERNKLVRDANTMTARSAMLMIFGLCMGCDVILEQPASSFMLLHPRMMQIIELSSTGCIRPLWQVQTNMGSFGAETLKPTFLFGSAPWMRKLCRDASWFRDAQSVHDIMLRLVRSQVDEFGAIKIWGAAALKGTQVYPAGYGLAISKLLQTGEHAVDESFEDAPEFRTADREHWLDACLLNVWEIIVSLA